MATALLGAAAAPAWDFAERQRSVDPQLWVGSTDLSHVAAQVQPDAQLGLNFGVGLIGAGDLSQAADILLSVDLADVSGVVVVTGLTAACDAAPTLITCRVTAAAARDTHQSMTLTAAAAAVSGSTGTITVSATVLTDPATTPAVGPATVDVFVVPDPAPTTPTAPSEAPTTPVEPPPPVVIAPLPTVPPGKPVAQEQSAPATVVTTPTPGAVVTFRSTLGHVPEALATRQPGFIQNGADGNRYISYAGTAPASRWGSPALTIALGASSMGLLALVIFGFVTARRANRPASATRRSGPGTFGLGAVDPPTVDPPTVDLSRRGGPGRPNDPTRRDPAWHDLARPEDDRPTESRWGG
jgi:hypothetical protein